MQVSVGDAERRQIARALGRFRRRQVGVPVLADKAPAGHAIG